MRKWMRIPAVLLLLLAVILVPKSEIELHKRRCQAAWNRLEGKSITERIKGVYYKVTKTKPSGDRWNENFRELQSSREALIELGYLVRERVELSSWPTRHVRDAFHKEPLHGPFVWAELGLNDLFVAAPASEIGAATNAVRRIDESLKRDEQETERR